MKRIVRPVVILAVMFAALPALAYAQATRTWVSGVGDDVNPCSRTAPCKTFAGAISKTATRGQINVLDPGGYGAVTITKPITIRAEFVEAGVLATSGTTGIIVNTPNATDNVVLEGLDIEGGGTTLGAFGVRVIKGNVVIRRCSIHQFSTAGVALQPAAANDAKVLIQDSVISQSNVGVNINAAGTLAATAVIDRTTLESNTTFGIHVGVGSALFLSGSSLIGAGHKVKLVTPGAPAPTFTSYGTNIIRGATDLPTSTVSLM